MTVVPAAPIVGAAVLSYELLAQFVKAAPEHDLLLDSFRATALSWIEKHSGRSVQRRGWVAMYDGFTPGLRLPRGPVHQVETIGYVDGQHAVTSMTAWSLSGDVLLPISGARWPVTALVPGAVTVSYTAGHIDLGTEAPELQTAALLLVRHLYDGGGFDDVPRAVRALCAVIRGAVIA